MVLMLLRFIIYYLFMAILVVSSYPQSEAKGFVSKELKDVAQSIGLTQGTRWALIIGIADYPPSQTYELQQLKSSVNDARALAEFFADPQRGGFDDQKVFILTNENATKRNILMKFNDIAKQAKPDDMVILYFSGHGYRSIGDETSYLIPYDYDMDDPETTCINFDDLSNKIKRIEAKKVIVILDACHSGGVKPKGARATATSSGIVQKYSEAFQKSEGRHLLLSSDENEVSWETDAGGVFTQFLLNGLEGLADANKDGIVTFSEVSIYVENKVPEYTRGRFPKVQTPMRRGDLGGEVRGDIPLSININEVNQINQENIRKKRYEAIISKDMPREIREFSLSTVKIAYDKSINNESLTALETSFLADIDSLQSGNISLDEFILRAQIFYEKMKGFPIKTSKIDDKKTDTMTSDIKKTSLATIAGKNMPPDTKIFVNDNLVSLPYQGQAGNYNIRIERNGFQTIKISQTILADQTFLLHPQWVPIKKNQRNPRLGLSASYVIPLDSNYDPNIGFQFTINLFKIPSIYLNAEFNAEYYNLSHYQHKELYDGDIEYEESDMKAFPLSFTMKFHPIQKNFSPFIGLGPTFMLANEHWHIKYNWGDIDDFSEFNYGLGGHIIVGADIALNSYIGFSIGSKYTWIVDDMMTLQFLGSLSVKF